jgi:protein TonB
LEPAKIPAAPSPGDLKEPVIDRQISPLQVHDVAPRRGVRLQRHRAKEPTIRERLAANKRIVALATLVHVLVLGVAWWLLPAPDGNAFAQGPLVAGLMLRDVVPDDIPEVVEALEQPTELIPDPEDVMPDERPPLPEPVLEDPRVLEPVESIELAPISLRMFDKRKPPAPVIVLPPPPRPPVVPVAPPPAPAVARAPVVQRKRPLKATFLPASEDHYPLAAKQARLAGVVAVGLEIAADGHVSRTWVHISSGYEILDQAAVRMMYEARFDPPGMVRRARQDVRFRFRTR